MVYDITFWGNAHDSKKDILPQEEALINMPGAQKTELCFPVTICETLVQIIILCEADDWW
jgi:hypothetical protein